MNARRWVQLLAVLFGILVLLWGIYLYRQVPRGRKPFAKALPQAAMVVLAEGGDQVRLEKRGNEWFVAAGTAPAVFPADPGRTKSLTEALPRLEVTDEISRRPAAAAQFEVNEASGTRVALRDAKGAVLAEGIFGKPAPDFAHVYFRYPDRPEVYLARGVIRGELGDADLDAWRSRQIIDVPDEQVKGVEIQGPGFETKLVRSSDTWSLNGQPVEPAPVYGLIGSLAHLQADAIIDASSQPVVAARGFDYARVVLTTADRRIELQIGPMDNATKRHPVRRDAEGGLWWLSESKVQSILLKPSAFQPKK